MKTIMIPEIVCFEESHASLGGQTNNFKQVGNKQVKKNNKLKLNRDQSYTETCIVNNFF